MHFFFQKVVIHMTERHQTKRCQKRCCQNKWYCYGRQLSIQHQGSAWFPQLSVLWTAAHQAFYSSSCSWLSTDVFHSSLTASREWLAYKTSCCHSLRGHIYVVMSPICCLALMIFLFPGWVTDLNVLISVRQPFDDNLCMITCVILVTISGCLGFTFVLIF